MSTQPGLRERKKQRTRQALVDAAHRLFRDHGYQQTTVADIAAAADVSTRTFFQHFPTKDDVLFVDADERLARLWALAGDRRPDETPVTALRLAVLQMLDETLRELPTMGLIRLDVLAATPGLQAPILERLARIEREAAGWLAGEMDTSPDQLEVTVAATALAHGLWTVVWRRLADAAGDQDRLTRALEDLREDIDRALTLLETGLSTLAAPAPDPHPPAETHSRGQGVR